MVWLNVAIQPVDISQLIENEYNTLIIKCDLPESYEESNESKEVICELPNIENFSAITHLIISRCHLEEFPDSLEVFHNLILFDISFNRFQKVPACLENNMTVIKKIDLSHNRIENFDFVPACVRTLKELNINNNAIKFFPKWLNKAINLISVDVEDNPLSKDQAIDNTLSIKILNISNCNFSIEDLNILENFPSLECLILGSKYSTDRIQILPVDILQKVPKLQILNMNHSELYDITDINILDNLTIINLECNRLKFLPNEFTLLKNLKDCKLSSNMIRTLPENFSQLRNLEKLHLDHNLLTELPESLSELPFLSLLDVYNNILSEVPKIYKKLKYFDISRNDVNEPDNEIYTKIKEDLRQKYNYNLRRNARLTDIEVEIYKHNSSDESESDSSFEEYEPPETVEENWDSDSEWEPSRNIFWDWSHYNKIKDERENQYKFSAVPGQFDD